jgi:DNA-binding NarL/FixJ family response regulator/class 3 adenylate cyclase
VAERTTTATAGIFAFLIADVRGYTAFTHERGDEAAGKLAAKFADVARVVVRARGGEVVELRGDEAVCVFRSTRDALRAAVELQERFVDETLADPAVPLGVGIGLDAGEAVPVEGGYRGAAVNVAARLCGQAGAGEILATREVVHLARRVEGVAYEEKEALSLKGVADAVEVVGVSSEAGPAAARLASLLPGSTGVTDAALRVVVADDSVILREGLVRLLTEAGFEVVGQAGDAAGLLAQVNAHGPDVAIVDIRMPPTHTDEGLRAARELRALHPQLGVLVLSQYVRPSYAFELLGEGTEGIGYLLKDRVSDLGQLADAVRRVGEGGSVLDPSVVEQLVRRRRMGNDPVEDLTERELEVLGHMAEGRSNKAVADRLFITEHTVEKHVQNIFAKLRIPATTDDHRRVLAVLTFLNSN